MIPAELMNLLYPALLVLGGWWIRNWTGPLATLLRRFAPAPSPTPAPGPAPDGSPAIPLDWDAIKRLIPDVPGVLWDDLARAAVDALAGKLRSAAPEKKLPLVRRVLDLIENLDEPPALKG